jgi:zinc/manganese transport system substrate-binding protein
MKNSLLPFLAAIALLPGTAFSKLDVVATLPTYGAIAKEIGGDKVKVTSLARGTEDAHFVDAKPSFIRVLNRADILIEGGADLEAGWLPPLVGNARNRKIIPSGKGRVVLRHGIRMLEVPQGPISRAQGDVHAFGNPHFELDPENGRLIARHIASAFSGMDSRNKAVYEANLKTFEARLDEKMIEWKKLAAPLKNVPTLSYHKTYEYLAKRFGFKVIGYIEPKPGIAPSPAYVSRLVPQMKGAGVKLVIMEPNRSSRTPSYIADRVGAKLVVLSAMVGGTKQADSYFGLIESNLHAMVNALK